MTENDWRELALCREVDPELFFTSGRVDASHNREQIRQAKSVCHRCPSASRCLVWSIETRQEYGVWGGLDEAERRRVLGSRLYGASK
jgi:WhiB family redox-sensing transcriptional regulator